MGYEARAWSDILYKAHNRSGSLNGSILRTLTYILQEIT